jgi:hypothetical protein
MMSLFLQILGRTETRGARFSGFGPALELNQAAGNVAGKPSLCSRVPGINAASTRGSGHRGERLSFILEVRSALLTAVQQFAMNAEIIFDKILFDLPRSASSQASIRIQSYCFSFARGPQRTHLEETR